MSNRYELETEIHSAIVREMNEKSEAEEKPIEKSRRRALMLYALNTNLENPTQNIGFGQVVPSIFFTKLFD